MQISGPFLSGLHSSDVTRVSKPDASQLRQRLRRNEEARREHVSTMLECGDLIVGSFMDRGRKCGYAGCHCATGEKHYSKVLSRRRNGKNHHTHVPARDEMDVAEKWMRFRRFRRARTTLVKLAAQTSRLADELEAALAVPYPSVDRPPSRRHRDPDARKR